MSAWREIILVAFSTAYLAVSAGAEQIRIRVVDGRNGRPVKDERLNFIRVADPHRTEGPVRAGWVGWPFGTSDPGPGWGVCGYRCTGRGDPNLF